MPSYRNAFFDAAGTLFKLRQSVGEGYAAVAQRFEIELDPDAVQQSFFRRFQQLPDPYPSLNPNPERGWWHHLVGQVFADCGAALDERCFQALWEFYGNGAAWELYPETRKVLRDLRNIGVRLILVTNFDDRIFPILEEFKLDREFEGRVVTSAQARCRKPGREIFEVARRMALPGATIHVGDDPVSDWAGGRKAGLDVFELHRPENTLDELWSILDQGA